jgi:hypothetical protein
MFAGMMITIGLATRRIFGHTLFDRSTFAMKISEAYLKE